MSALCILQVSMCLSPPPRVCVFATPRLVSFFSLTREIALSWDSLLYQRLFLKEFADSSNANWYLTMTMTL